MGMSANINLTCPAWGKKRSWQTRAGGGYGHFEQEEVDIGIAAMLDGVEVRCCESYEGENPAGYMDRVKTPHVHVPAESAKGCGAVLVLRAPEAVAANREYPVRLTTKEHP